MLFLSLTSFTIFKADRDCLSSTKFSILLMWPWMYSNSSFLQFFYFSAVLPTGRVWHKAFFKVGPGAGPLPRPVRHFQKCLQAPKKGCLRRQAITPPPRRVKSWGTALWGSRYIQKTGHTRPYPCRWYHGRLKCASSTGFNWFFWICLVSSFLTF